MSLARLALQVAALAMASAVGAADQPICAIDMGSNSFKRIVGSFHQGR